MRRVALGLALVGLPVLAGGCVTQSEFRQLQNQVHKVSGGEVGAQTRAELADLSARLETLTREIDELRGQLEVVQHSADRALEEAERARLEANEGGRPASVAPAADLGPGADAAGGLDGTSGGPDGTSGGGVDSSPGALSMSSEEMRQYRASYGAWRRGEVQACIEGFRDFLQTYPSSDFADDALYWMADCYYKQGDHEKAILRFAKVVEMYPTGNKAPDALFRQGEVLQKLGPSYDSAARDVFQRVLSEYPDSPRAAEAQRQLDRLGAG